MFRNTNISIYIDVEDSILYDILSLLSYSLSMKGKIWLKKIFLIDYLHKKKFAYEILKYSMIICVLHTNKKSPTIVKFVISKVIRNSLKIRNWIIASNKKQNFAHTKKSFENFFDN